VNTIDEVCRLCRTTGFVAGRRQFLRFQIRFCSDFCLFASRRQAATKLSRGVLCTVRRAIAGSNAHEPIAHELLTDFAGLSCPKRSSA
jgi:hypothetical protein